MSNVYMMGPWVRRFLEEYIVTERNPEPPYTEELPGYLHTAAALCLQHAQEIGGSTGGA